MIIEDFTMLLFVRTTLIMQPIIVKRVLVPIMLKNPNVRELLLSKNFVIVKSMSNNHMHTCLDLMFCLMLVSEGL